MRRALQLLLKVVDRLFDRKTLIEGDMAHGIRFEEARHSSMIS